MINEEKIKQSRVEISSKMVKLKKVYSELVEIMNIKQLDIDSAKVQIRNINTEITKLTKEFLELGQELKKQKE